MSENDVGFISKGVINYVHSTIRLVGGNEFRVSTLDDFDTDEKNYVSGLYSTYFYMSLFFVLWLIVVLVIKCSQFQVPSFYDKYIGILLFIAIIVTVFGCVFTIISNVALKNSITSIEHKIADIWTVFTKTTNGIYFDSFNHLKEKNIQTNNVCDIALNENMGTSRNITYPYIHVLEKIIILENELKAIPVFFKETHDTLTFGAKEIRSRYSLWISLIYVFASFTFSSCFALIVIIYVSMSNSHAMNIDLSNKNILRLLVINVIFMFSISMITSDSGVYALVGSDFCHESPTKHLNYILDQHSTSQTTRTYLEKFEKCTFGSFVFENAIDKRNDLLSYLQNDVYDFTTQVRTLTGNTACQMNLNSTISYLSFTNNIFENLENNLSCGVANRLYNEIMYNSLCNNLVANVCSVWLSLSSTILAAMVILAIFLLFDIDTGNYDLLFY